jgi:cytochrome c oxidase subunit II
MREGAGLTRVSAITLLAFLASACNRHQSALSPFGEEAAQIRTTTIVMVIGAIVVAAAVAGLMIWAMRAREGRIGLVGGERLILLAGGAVPAIVLIALLAYSLPTMRARPVAAGDLKVMVTGEQFWWRVRYEPNGAPPLTSANEIRVPVGRNVLFRLQGGDVIHSFWIPGLAGKTDMIPGRETLLAVRATRPGIFRGQCTEFCGLSHALMAFDVVAMPPAAFDAWLIRQRQAATPGTMPGRALFARYGCGGCHAVAGTDQNGSIGPDLSHMGSRRTIAAGVLAPDAANIRQFIRHPERTKPGVRMPAFAHMPDADARAIAQYLQALR